MSTPGKEPASTRTASVADVSGGALDEEHPPSPPLREILLCTWSLCVGRDDHTQLVLPDGCVDIVFIGGSPPIVAGPATRPSTVRLARGTILVGARFRPGWARVGLGIPASELLDRDAVSLEDVWGPRARRFHDSVAQRPNAEGKLDELSRCLARLLDANETVDRAVDACVNALAEGARVRDVERTVGLSARHLQRRFAAAVGYGMKTFQRIVRFQHTLSIGRRAASLAELAVTVGYADQAHMTRDIVALSGATPARIIGRATTTLGLSDFFENDTAIEPIVRGWRERGARGRLALPSAERFSSS